MMRIDIISLFPEFIQAFYSHSIIGRAVKAGLLDLDVTNPRNFTYDRHRMADDTVYGGGCGMLMKAQPVFSAVESVRRGVEKRRIIFMGPAGERFTQAKARQLAEYILTGGELPAMIVTDAVARMIPGVLGASAGAADDSFAMSLLECPQYTKPADFRGYVVPEVLRNGDHAKIEAWRRKASLARTLALRPDLLAAAELSTRDLQILDDLKREMTV